MLGAAAVSSILPFPTPSHKHNTNPQLFFSNGRNPWPASSIFSSIRGRTTFSVSTSRRRGGGETDNDVSEKDDDGWEDDEGEGEGTPFDDMRRWLRNKPSGFGEGKSYDTMIEEKLLEEIEQSRKAQLANINKLKNNLTSDTANKDQQSKVIDILPSGTRVRVGNLPKKRNILRDLKLAFKGFTGIINISPAVTGSKKTRDPVCKGFAFVDLDSEEAAIRFVEVHSKQSVLFGKIQKQIICDIINPSLSSNSSSKHSDGVSCAVTPQINLDNTINSLEDEFKAIMDNRDSSPLSSQLVDGEMGIRYLDTTLLDNDGVTPKNAGNLDTEYSSQSSTQKQKGRAVSKKKNVKQKAQKLSVLGSAIRLKVKERNVLSGVFSKYGGKPAPTLAKES